MTIQGEDQLNDVRNETLFKFGEERKPIESQVQGCSASLKERVGAQANHVIIRVVVAAVG